MPASRAPTDIPTLFNILPGYLPMPNADLHADLDGYVADDEGKAGFWGNMRAYAVSLLKSYWGDVATAENDYCFDYLPRVTGDHSTYTTVRAQIEGRCKGYFLVGENPAVGSSNGKMQRLGMANLDWLVVRDLQMIESATFWQDGPEIETGELVTEEIGTEVFFLPAASHVEKAGSFTQTQRMLQWRDKAVEPPGDARSELDFYYELGQRLRAKLAGSTDEMDRPLLDLAWDYPVDDHGEVDAHAVLREINGTGPDGRALSAYTQLKAGRVDALRLLDLLRGLRRRGQPGPAAKAALGTGPGSPRMGLGMAGQQADPLQPGLGRPRRDPVERAQALRLVGRRPGSVGRSRRPRLRAGPAAGPRSRGGRKRPRRDRRHRPVHHADGREGLVVRPGRPGRRTHADPLRARPSRRWPTPCTGSRTTRRAGDSTIPVNPLQPEPERRLPLRVHDLPAHRAPHSGCDEPHAALSGRAAAGALLRGVAAARRRARARPTAAGPRSSPPAPRSRRASWSPTGCGRCGWASSCVEQVGLPYHWGPNGLSRGRLAERPRQPHAGPQRVHPGQGRHLRHPGRAATARARAARRTSRSTAGAQGSTRPDPSDGGADR